MIFPRKKSFSSLFYCTGVFKVTKSCESLLAEKTESCIPAISSRWWNAFLVCVSCKRWKPRGESNINPRGPTCWQELDVSAHSFALRFTPIASVPVIKASVLCVVSWKIEETPLSKFYTLLSHLIFFFSFELSLFWLFNGWRGVIRLRQTTVYCGKCLCTDITFGHKYTAIAKHNSGTLTSN